MSATLKQILWPIFLAECNWRDYCTTRLWASNCLRNNATGAQNPLQRVEALPRGEFFPRVKRPTPRAHNYQPLWAAGTAPPPPQSPGTCPLLAAPHAQLCRRLTFVAGGPGLVAVVAGDTEDPLLDRGEPHGSAGEVLHRAGPLQVLFDGLIHHQVLQLPQLRADVGEPPGADIGRAPHAAGGRERGVSDGGPLLAALPREPPSSTGPKVKLAAGGGTSAGRWEGSAPAAAAPQTFLTALHRSDARGPGGAAIWGEVGWVSPSLPARPHGPAPQQYSQGGGFAPRGAVGELPDPHGEQQRWLGGAQTSRRGEPAALTGWVRGGKEERGGSGDCGGSRGRGSPSWWWPPAREAERETGGPPLPPVRRCRLRSAAGGGRAGQGALRAPHPARCPRPPAGGAPRPRCRQRPVPRAP